MSRALSTTRLFTASARRRFPPRWGICLVLSWKIHTCHRHIPRRLRLNLPAVRPRRRSYPAAVPPDRRLAAYSFIVRSTRSPFSYPVLHSQSSRACRHHAVPLPPGRLRPDVRKQRRRCGQPVASLRNPKGFLTISTHEDYFNTTLKAAGKNAYPPYSKAALSASIVGEQRHFV